MEIIFLNFFYLIEFFLSQIYGMHIRLEDRRNMAKIQIDRISSLKLTYLQS